MIRNSSSRRNEYIAIKHLKLSILQTRPHETLYIYYIFCIFFIQNDNCMPSIVDIFPLCDLMSE